MPPDWRTTETGTEIHREGILIPHRALSQSNPETRMRVFFHCKVNSRFSTLETMPIPPIEISIWRQTELLRCGYLFHRFPSLRGERNGNLLQYSCLENCRDRGAWWAAVCGVAQSWTRLKWLSSSSSSNIITGSFAQVKMKNLDHLLSQVGVFMGSWLSVSLDVCLECLSHLQNFWTFIWRKLHKGCWVLQIQENFFRHSMML